MKELEILYELQIMMNNYDKVILLANDEPNIFLMANILSEVVR